MGRPICNGVPSCLVNVAVESTDFLMSRTRLLCWNTSLSIRVSFRGWSHCSAWNILLRQPPMLCAKWSRPLSSGTTSRSIKGLAERYDQLAEQIPETVEAIADSVKYTAGPVGSAMSCCLSCP